MIFPPYATTCLGSGSTVTLTSDLNEWMNETIQSPEELTYRSIDSQSDCNQYSEVCGQKIIEIYISYPASCGRSILEADANLCNTTNATASLSVIKTQMILYIYKIQADWLVQSVNSCLVTKKRKKLMISRAHTTQQRFSPQCYITSGCRVERIVSLQHRLHKWEAFHEFMLDSIHTHPTSSAQCARLFDLLPKKKKKRFYLKCALQHSVKWRFDSTGPQHQPMT